MRAYNSQNIPRTMRHLWIADDPDHAILSADWSQIEARLIAFFARDEEQTTHFLEGRDIHSIAAAALYGCEPERYANGRGSDEVMVQFEDRLQPARQAGKKFRHMRNYGAEGPKCSLEYDIPEVEAWRLIEADDRRWPAVARWRIAAVWDALRTNRVVLPTGRLREFWTPPRRRVDGTIALAKSGWPDWAEAKEVLAQWGQATAGDMMKLALARLPTDRLWTTTHDSFALHVRRTEIGTVARMVKAAMEEPMSGMVWEPFYPRGFWCPTELKMGQTWAGEEGVLDV